MKSIKEAPFMTEVIRMLSNMYRLGWDERNGGNLSYILNESEVTPYLDINGCIRKIPLKFDASSLAGKIFIVTGTGKYFKNAEYSPETTLGIIRILDVGNEAALLWGYEDGGAPTSELSSHLMSHIERLKIDKNHRVVMHTHPTNIIAMSHVHTLDEKAFTRTLWGMITECAVVFPDGVAVLPWMVCGGEEIGIATAEKMKKHRTVVWAFHGIFGTGNTLDEAFGLVETVEKAAEIYMKIKAFTNDSGITDEQLEALSKAFGFTFEL